MLEKRLERMVIDDIRSQDEGCFQWRMKGWSWSWNYERRMRH